LLSLCYESFLREEEEFSFERSQIYSLIPFPFAEAEKELATVQNGITPSSGAPSLRLSSLLVALWRSQDRTAVPDSSREDKDYRRRVCQTQNQLP